MRSSLALIATVGLVAALTGCAAGSAPQATTGASTEAVTVTGDFGSEPKVSFPTPITPTETQCEVLVEGEGPTIQEGQLVEAAFVAYDGETGEKLGTAGFGDQGGSPLTRGTDKSNYAFDKGLSCAREGSRVLVVAADYDAFGDGTPVEGEAPGNGVILVLDVLRAFPTKADGVPQLTRDGFPAVVLAPDGRPGITVPKADPPAAARETTQTEVLKSGNGPVVEDGDTVVVQYTGVLWDDNSVFDSSWEKGASGEPATFTVSTGEDAQVITGFSKAIIGQKVGSQLGIIIPPSEGYGDAGAGQTIPGGATLFFVVDILGVV